MNNLFQQFDQLKTSITAFTRSLEQQDNTYWMADWHGPSSQVGLDSALNDLWYQEDQDGRETRLYPGLVSLNRQQLTYATEINLLKDQIRQTVQQLKEAEDSQWREVQLKLAQRHRVLHEHLSRDGLNRLHLKQLFRHIPIVVTRPEKVGFSWYTSGRSIKKISKAEALAMLLKLNTEAAHIKIQLERLSSVSDSEPLARVQRQAPVLRANLVFPDRKRKSMNVSLPLMFPSEGKQDLPDFNVPLPTPPADRSRLQRSDNKLEEEPFLPSIRVHRYIQPKQPFSFYNQ